MCCPPMMFKRSHGFGVFSVVLTTLLVPSVKAMTDDIRQLNRSLGRESAVFYCQGRDAASSLEKGTLTALQNTPLSMDQISEADLSSDEAGLLMIESMMSYAIDHCPQRAKQLFRDMDSLP